MKTLEAMNAWAEVYKKKNIDYGNSWEKTGKILDVLFDGKEISIKTVDDYNALAILIRMLDKFARFSNIYFVNKDNKINESLHDSICDLGVYAFMLSEIVSEDESSEKPTECLSNYASKAENWWHNIQITGSCGGEISHFNNEGNQLHQIHQKDEPVVKHGTGIVSTAYSKAYYKDGQFHREDGPAVEFTNGRKDWYINGQRHREDGPAVEKADGHKEWYINGMRHREDGPAIEFPNGRKEWWLSDVCQRME